MKKIKTSAFMFVLAAALLTGCVTKGGSSIEDESKEQPTSKQVSSSKNEEVSSRNEESSEEGHTHTWDTKWSYDSTHHWHQCTVVVGGTPSPWGGGMMGGTQCTEIKDKEPHTMNSGTITKQPSAYETGVKTFKCTKCDYSYTETIPATGGDEQQGSFTFGNDLETVQDFHTQDQKNYLNHTGEYYSITSSQLNGYNAKGTAEKSFPEQVKLTWGHTVPSGKTIKNYQIYTGQKADLSDGYLITGSTSKEISFYNAFLGTNYFKVIANFTDNTSEVSEIKSFKVTEQAPRNLKVGSMSNCRDMGGRTTVAGGKIKQGMLYRTSDPANTGVGDISEWTKRMNIKSEIYVRDGSKSSGPLSGVTFYNASMDYGSTPYSNMSRNAERLRKVFSILADEKNYPSMYHCRIGSDRTGICGIMLNGVLGVSFNDTIQDYLFSNFGKIDNQRYVGLNPDNNGDDIAKYVGEVLKMPGKNFQEQCYYSLLSIGVPASDIAKVIDIMTEGNKAALPNDYVLVGANNMVNNNGTKKTCSDFTAPDSYIEISSGKSVSMTANVKTAGETSVVVYLGCTDSSSSKKLSSGISLKIDGNETSIIDKTYFLSGFGKTGQAQRTGYMFSVLATPNLTAGEHTIQVSGKNSDTFGVARVGLFPKTSQSSGESGGQGEGGGQQGGDEHTTHTWGTATPVADSGKTAYTKQTCECGAARLVIKATDMTLTGTNKDGTPSGFIKLNAAGDKITATFNYNADKAGKICIDGIMDSWSGNKSKTMYSGKSATTSNGNFGLTVNGVKVDFSDKKNTTYETLFGSGNNPTLGSSYSAQAEVEIGSTALKNGENTIVFERIDSYNILAANFVIYLEK